MKNIREKIESIGLNYKKEIAKIVIPSILCLLSGVGLFYYLHNVIYIGCGFILIIIICFIYSLLLERKVSTYHHDNECEFVAVTNYIQTYLSNGFNVYKSIEATIQYVSEWMKGKLAILLSSIDEDKTIAPFIAFSHNFNSSIVEQVMISLFLMVENGAKQEYIVRFTPIFNQLEKDSERKILKKLESSFDTLNLLPVVGSALITLLIITGIVGLIGGALNGI